MLPLNILRAPFDIVVDVRLEHSYNPKRVQKKIFIQISPNMVPRHDLYCIRHICSIKTMVDVPRLNTNPKEHARNNKIWGVREREDGEGEDGEYEQPQEQSQP